MLPPPPTNASNVPRRVVWLAREAMRNRMGAEPPPAIAVNLRKSNEMKTFSKGATVLIASTLLAWGGIATADAYGDCVSSANAAATAEYNRVLQSGMKSCQGLGEAPGLACVAAVTAGAKMSMDSKREMELRKCSNLPRT